MMHKRIMVILVVLLCASGFAFAQSSGGDFEIIKSTIDSGGGTSLGGAFSLSGSIGQHDANHQLSSGGEFALAGGFWVNAPINDVIFKNGFETN